MSLYYEAADVLTAPTNAGGSLKSRIFSKKDLKSQPAQIYALAIETCKWSSILKEIVENADILRLERKGIALPAAHGLRASIERHKGRLQSELTKARIRRKLSSIEALKAHVEAGHENSSDTSEAPYPRWIRINTLKTSLEDQLDTTFAGYERATTVEAVRHRGAKRLFIDSNIPNLLATSPCVDLSKSDAYKSGAIIFQDKASCFPAYLLDPLPEDGDIIDSCSAPGNKTTHIASILLGHSPEPNECSQVIHAFEKNKGRAETLEKMVNLAGSDTWTKLHAGQDFLKADPKSSVYKNVGALLLDPSCSGSGIVGRDDMPHLNLPVLKQAFSDKSKHQKKGAKAPDLSHETRKRKRDDREDKDDLEVMVDDDGVVSAVNTEDELKARLAALSDFQTQLLLHAFRFPSARKITYSTCSIHAQENEDVVMKALDSAIAKERGWRILKREDQIRGMKEWPVRGLPEACDDKDDKDDITEACIRANKGDERGTMGFFLAGFVRDQAPVDGVDEGFLRDEKGHLVRDLLGFPTKVQPDTVYDQSIEQVEEATPLEEEEWGGFGVTDNLTVGKEADVSLASKGNSKPKKPLINRHSHSAVMNRPQLNVKKDKKRKKA